MPAWGHLSLLGLHLPLLQWCLQLDLSLPPQQPRLLLQTRLHPPLLRLPAQHR
jgi:hypothetical protein